MRRRFLLRPGFAYSVLAHGLTLTCFLLSRPIVPAVHTRTAGISTGTLIALTYNPGGMPAPRVKVALSRPHPTPSHVPALKAHVLLPAPPTKPAATSGTAGEVSLGDGDITIALTRYFPVPRPDLSALHPGTAGDVIVDVVIDAQGHITTATLVRGIEQTVDRTVMATVQTWTFSPATKDGIAIASRQELLFHYERA